MSFCSSGQSGGQTPAPSTGMATPGTPAAATASNSMASPTGGDPGPGVLLKPDGAAPTGQDFYLDPKSGQALNGAGGGWRDAINEIVRSRMPAGVQSLLGSAGMAGMPTPGVNGADYATPRGNAPTTVAAGMATPGTNIPILKDPATNAVKGGGNGVASGMASGAAKSGGLGNL